MKCPRCEKKLRKLLKELGNLYYCKDCNTHLYKEWVEWYWKGYEVGYTKGYDNANGDMKLGC